MEEVRGVLQIRFRKENGWTVASLRGTTLDVVGVLPIDITDGSSVVLRGEHQKHARFGDQFKFKEAQLDLPRDEVAIVEYLSINFSGVGAILARRIFENFGKGIFAALEADPCALVDVQGVTEKQSKKMYDIWMEKKATFEYDKFFSTCGLTPTMRNRFLSEVAKTFKLRFDPEVGATPDLCHEAKSIVEANPYTLIQLVEGIGFKKADLIAKRLGFIDTDPRRVRAAILHILIESSQQGGHCCLPPVMLVSLAQRLLGIDAQIVWGRLDEMLNDHDEICYDINRAIDAPEGFIALTYIFELEKKVSKHFQRTSQGEFRDATVGEWVENWEYLTGEQREAVRQGITCPLFLLTGLPGTGKTFTLSSILSALDEANLTVLLAAPTGKAAKRMTQQTGRHASTIHRLLEFNPATGWGRSEDNPVPSDVVIIDEASMIDVFLANRLLQAIGPETSLVLVGDPNQLPSVGPGRIFNDLIESGLAPNVHLTQIMRQAEGSLIIQNAHAVHLGRNMAQDPRPAESQDFHLFCKEEYLEPEVMRAEVMDTIRWFQQTKNLGMRDIQVLCPTNKEGRSLSTSTFNPLLRQVFNPQGATIPGWFDAYVGDRIMQTRNDYRREIRPENSTRTGVDDPSQFTVEGLADKVDADTEYGVFNGEIGVIQAFQKETNEVVVRWDDDRISRYPLGEARSQLKVAYAISVHKSQGSEFPLVVFVCHRTDTYMLHRNLVYTAITRAQNYLAFFATPGTESYAIGRNDADRRMTNLKLLLIEEP